MTTTTRLLIVDDDPAQRGMLLELLHGAAGEVAAVASGEEALAHLDDVPADLLLVDMRMPGMGGLGLLEELRKRELDVPIVMMTAYAEVEDAVRAMKLGARDYLRKPLDIDALREIVDRHLGSPVATAGTPERPALPDGVVFDSPVMLELLGELRRLARSEVPVLLCGETGTGKEVLAELLHRWGARSEKPMVTVNVAALPEALLEAELFGAQRGAYTGADRDRAGRIEEAAGGTLFLDEVGELPTQAQPKLLRALETGRVARLGGGRETAVDVRFLAATNRELETEVEEGRFRRDLYYRIAVVTVEVPPLRERREEILPLARRFLVEAAGEARAFSPAAEALLLAYRWPGNIRELRNAMLRAAILAPGDRVLPEHLPPDVRAAAPQPAAENGAEPRSLADIEREAILTALDRCDGNRTHAAKELGISRRTLLYRLKEYGQRDRRLKSPPDLS